ncbi:MAG: ATP-dependent DNA helicase RecQ [Balneolales bacterium]
MAEMRDLYSQSLANLKKYWGFSAFRPGQEEVIRSLSEDKAILVLFPTGGGKSLCYQVPATVIDGLTIVISPLVALMQDQVSQLKSAGISATFINSTLTRDEIEQRIVNARNGMYKILYCSPERLKTPIWQKDLMNMPIRMVAIDEAHCISEWGHDFRPTYREIKANFEPIADRIKWMALTATATPEVRDDIIRNLGFSKPIIISKGFERPNLKWWVIREEQKEKRLLQIVLKASGNGLVYAGTRKACDVLSQNLRDHKIKAKAYHAGLDSDQRKSIQEDWIRGKTTVVVATNAFGMGIDKSDCRYVVHYDMPYSLEAYYQEAGRAGRDGKESYPILLAKKSDYTNAKSNIEQSYPTRDELKLIYTALCDHWNLASGSEMEEAERIIIESLVTRSKLPKRKQLAGIRILEQLGILQMQDYVKSQLGVKILISRNDFQDALSSIKKKQKREFIDGLVRLFGPGCFQKVHYMDTEYVQKKLNIGINSLTKAMNVLAGEHFLQFDIITDQPIARLIDARSSHFPFSKKELEAHRNRLFQKLEFMMGYVETKACRSTYMRHYFGEVDVSDCGYCDICLAKKGETDILTDANIKAICNFLKEKPRSLKEISRATKLNPSSLKPLLARLTRENIIDTQYGVKGIVYLINK